MTKHFRLLLLILILAIAIAAYIYTQRRNHQFTPPVVIRPSDVTAQDIDFAVRANNTFAIDLFRAMKEKQNNLTISPLSVFGVLSAIHEGARGETATQMAAVLHIPANARIAKGYSEFRWQMLGGDTHPYVLNIANSLWCQSGYGMKAEYCVAIETNYGATLESLDFANPEKSRRTINAWASDQTAGKIQTILPPNSLTPLTRLVLANAFYFNGKWEHVFEKSKTDNAPFYVEPNKLAKAQTMQRKIVGVLYMEDETLQLLVLPYKDGAMSMVILLPKAMDGLAALESKLSEEQFRTYMDNTQPREVELYLPRWKNASAADLTNILSGLGMPLAFDDKAADLSGISGKNDLFLSAVFHSVFIDVSEEGTEAAAATAASVNATSAVWGRPNTGPVIFRADHPFLFLIVHSSKPILFIGRVSDPTR